MVAMVVLAGMAVTVAVSMWLWNSEERRVERELERGVEVLVASTADAISDAEARLIAVSALYESSEEVGQEEFRRFVDKLGLLPGLGGIGYMPLVGAEDLDGFVAEMQDAVPGFGVFEVNDSGERVPVAARSEYAPVQWFEPSDAFGTPNGYDSLSDPVRAAALETARSTGAAAATPFLQLISEQESDGFLLYWPTIDPETEQVSGFALAPLDLSELLDSRIPATLQGQVGWNVVDLAAATTDLATGRSSDGSWVSSLEVGGLMWRLAVTPRASSDMVASPTVPLLALAIGLFATVLAGLGMHLYRQRSQARQELDSLRDLARAKDQFLASVSHELRTPLTGVLGFAELLKDSHGELSEDERLSMISSVADEAADLAHIIEDLLVAARSELDLLVVTRVPVDVRAQVAQVLEATEGGTAERFEVLGNPDGSYRATGDPTRVRQILRNLISNATRYGGDQVQVRPALMDNTVQLQVADNGPGLPQDEWERIFEPYYRSHHSATQPAAVGIGLSVARQLARLMQGDLTYRREDNWSVFELRLPIAGTFNIERGMLDPRPAAAIEAT